MKVKVSILDRDVVDQLVEKDLVERQAVMALVISPADIERSVQELQNAHFAVYSSSANAALEAVAQTVNMPADIVEEVCIPESERDEAERDRIKGAIEALDDRAKEQLGFDCLATQLESDFSMAWNPAYDEFRRAWLIVQENLARLYTNYERVNASDESELRAAGQSILLKLEERNILLANFFSRVREDLNISNSSPSDSPLVQAAERLIQENPNIKAKLEQDINRVYRAQGDVELFDSGGLEHSRYASVVVGVDDEHWEEKFDHSRGFGIFGNTDIAIKALGPTNFTIKGLSFNPADVANAASKVTTQAILLAAQISGVPVNVRGTPTDTGSQLAQASTALQQVRIDNSKTLGDIETFNKALLTIARAIVFERTALEGDNAEAIKESLDVIRAVYQSQQAPLEAVSQSTGSSE